MRLLSLLVLTLIALPAAAQPVIAENGLHNGASFSSLLFWERGMAPGMIFVIRGAELGPEELVSAAAPYPLRLPEIEGGTEVRVRSLADSVEVRTPLIHSSARQVAGILPRGFPLGPAELTLSWRGIASESVALEIIASAPGLFTISQSGSGPGVIQNYESPGITPLNGLTRPARPGQYIILWGTGIGLPETELKVVIGDTAIRPDYAGPAPGYPGLDQINVRLPDDGSLPLGCYTRVALQVKDRRSHSVFLSTAEAGACEHPWGLPEDRMAELDAGRTVDVVRLWTYGTGRLFEVSEHEALLAEFRKLNAAEVSVYPMHSVGAVGAIFGWEPGTTGCSSSHGSVISSLLRGDPSLTPPPRPVLDAGETLQLAGPGGKHLILHKAEDFQWSGAYGSDPERDVLSPGWFDGGGWVLSAPGGAGLNGFNVPLTLPSPVRAVIPDTVVRTAGVTVRWNRVDILAETVYFRIAVYGQPEPSPEDPGFGARDFDEVFCFAPAAAGEFTIDPLYLNRLPAAESAVFSLSPWLAEGYEVEFDIPGADRATFRQTSSHSQAVTVE